MTGTSSVSFVAQALPTCTLNLQTRQQERKASSRSLDEKIMESAGFSFESKRQIPFGGSFCPPMYENFCRFFYPLSKTQGITLLTTLVFWWLFDGWTP